MCFLTVFLILLIFFCIFCLCLFCYCSSLLQRNYESKNLIASFFFVLLDHCILQHLWSLMLTVVQLIRPHPKSEDSSSDKFHSTAGRTAQHNS